MQEVDKEMATTRKPAKKAAKKTAKKKVAAASTGASVTLAGAIPKMQMSMPLDDKRIAAIQRCIKKGTLTVTLSKVDLSGGKLGGPWLYD
jgi:anti-sigma28 factor (negative regulator of flagellin synthesis)